MRTGSAGVGRVVAAGEATAVFVGAVFAGAGAGFLASAGVAAGATASVCDTGVAMCSVLTGRALTGVAASVSAGLAVTVWPCPFWPVTVWPCPF